MKLRTALAALTIVTGCSTAKPPAERVSRTPPQVVDPPAQCVEIAAPTGPRAAIWKRRDDAVHLLVTGAPSVALEALDAIVREHPSDVGAYAMRAAAQSTIAREGQQGNASRARMAPVHVGGAVVGESRLSKQPKPALTVLSSDDGQRSSDDRDLSWFDRNKLRDPVHLDEAALVASPIRGGEASAQARFVDHSILVFGDTLAVVSPPSGLRPRAYDLHDVATPGSSIRFAQVVDRLLVVLVAGEDGALLAGVDLDANELVWRTDRHVVDGRSFAVTGTHAVVPAATEDGAQGGGSGGALVVVDLASGRSVDTVSLPFVPAWALAKDGKVLAAELTQVSSAVLGPKTGALPPPRPAGLADEPAKTPTEVALEECQYRRALDAIDARDVERAERETISFVDADAPAARALLGATTFIRQAKLSPESTTDLAGAPVVVLEAPPDGAVSRAPRRALAPAPVIASTKAPPKKDPKKKPPAPGPRKPPQPAQTDEPVPVPGQAPSMEGLPAPSFMLPVEYGAAQLMRSVAFPQPNGSKPTAFNVGVYGDSFVALLADKRAVRVFDARAMTSDRIRVLDAAIVGDALVVAIGDASAYAGADVDGFVAAFDRETGALRWRSEPRVVSTQLLPVGDYVITARGSSTEPSRVVVLRSDTGETESSLRASCVIDSFGWSGRELLAICTSDWETFTVTR